MTEAELQIKVAEYLIENYPDVQFHSDFGSGVKLTPHQAKVQKAQNGGRRGWPDLFIAEVDHYMAEDEYASTNDIFNCDNSYFMGLFIELKKEGTRLRKKNGEWASEHIKEQDEVLKKLRERGYKAEFACGFDEAKKIIDDYLGGK